MQGERSRRVEDDVGEESGSIGQEALMEFVGARDHESGGDRENLADELPPEGWTQSRTQDAGGAVAESEPESAETSERKQAIADEVAGFANEVMGVAPALIDGRAEDGLAEAVKRSRCVVCAEGSGRLNGENADEDESR